MSKDRKVYAPFSLTSELGGVTQTPVEGYIDVEQRIKPVLTVGSVNEKGVWAGIKSDDRQFIAFSRDEGIPDGAEILTPTTNADGTWPLDMTGFNDLLIAIKPSNGGNYKTEGIMGPDTLRFANLEPVNPGVRLRGNRNFTGESGFSDVLIDSTESLTADVWNIFIIFEVLKHQKLCQFKITNNSGGNSTIECAFMRLV